MQVVLVYLQPFQRNSLLKCVSLNIFLVVNLAAYLHCTL